MTSKRPIENLRKGKSKDKSANLKQSSKSAKKIPTQDPVLVPQSTESKPSGDKPSQLFLTSIKRVPQEEDGSNIGSGDTESKTNSYLNAITETLTFVRRLFHYLSRSKFALTLAMSSVFLIPWARVKLPEITGLMIDAVLLKHNPVEMEDTAKLFLATCALCAVFEFFYNYLFDYLSTEIQSDLKQDAYLGIIQRNLPYFEKVSPSDIINHVDGQIYAVQNSFTKEFPCLLRNLVTIVYSIWILATFSVKLTLFVITISPIFLILSFGYSTFYEKAVKEEIDSSSKALSRISETLTNIKIVKASSTEKSELERFRDLLQESKRKSHKKAFLGSLNISGTQFLINGTFLMGIYMGMTLINIGEITPGGLCGYLFFIVFLTSSFRDLIQNYTLIKGSFPICQDFFNLLDTNSKVVYRDGNTISNFQGSVMFKNVNFSYPPNPNGVILKNISFNINSGDKIAFVGPKNAGKSTIISLLLRFHEEFKGEIKLGGIDIRNLDVKWLRQQIGYVSQEPVLFNGTVEENIAYGIEGYSKEKLLKIVKLANADFIFNRSFFPSGLQTNLQEEMHKLSGGQKQRLAIARALMKDPKILIFEEPMNNLDEASELEVQKAIDNLLEYWEVTTILVAEKVASVAKSKTIYVVSDGKIVEQGSHKELIMKGGVYKSMVEKQLHFKP